MTAMTNAHGALRFVRLPAQAISVCVALGLSLPGIADAAARDPRAVREFRKANPCPSTGKTRGACPNWQVDHKTPLCAGGADTPENLQWLHVDQHRDIRGRMFVFVGR